MSEINPIEYWGEKASPQALQELALANRALQTQLDEANARLAMQHEALCEFKATYTQVCDLKDNGRAIDHHEGLTAIINVWLRYGKPALNATEADVEAWEERRDKKVRDAYRAGPYTDACKQLATVTAERDALRRALDFYAQGKHLKHSGGLDSTANMTIEIIDHGEVAKQALAQKGGE